VATLTLESRFNVGDAVFFIVENKGLFRGFIYSVSVTCERNNNTYISYNISIPNHGILRLDEDNVYSTPNEAFNF
jgi:hypothetical protein